MERNSISHATILFVISVSIYEGRFCWQGLALTPAGDTQNVWYEITFPYFVLGLKLNSFNNSGHGCLDFVSNEM